MRFVSGISALGAAGVGYAFGPICGLVYAGVLLGIDLIGFTTEDYRKHKSNSKRDSEQIKQAPQRGFASGVSGELPVSQNPVIPEFVVGWMVNLLPYTPKEQGQSTKKKRKIIKYLGRNKASTSSNYRAKHGKRLVPTINN